MVSSSGELHQLSFNEQLVEVAKLIKIECNEKSASFDSIMLVISSKHRKRTDIINRLINISVNNLYNDKFVEYGVDYELKKQIAKITKQYFSIQLTTPQLAAQYVFTPRKENVLIPLMAYCWINYKSKSLKCSYKDLPTSLIIICVSILGAVPWFQIMSAFYNNRKPQSSPINPDHSITDEGLLILTKEFHKPMPKHKVQGFSNASKLRKQ
ncbi:hypothetical protein CAL7716_102630 (plasmid) [Calothrix sp. PCC 7716]|nr:hypothetical protein CAL7716_102630 [Calothrix sp. PCC 7716]